MNLYIKFAWRNLWRNRRRTLITAASIFFGVLFATFMSSMQEGTYESNIENVVRFYTGYAQLQHPEYWDEKTLEHSMNPSDSLLNALEEDPAITSISPRLEYFALASHKEATKVASIVGIDPKQEKQVTNILDYLHEGEYLETGENGILLGKMLAENLGLEVGDTLTLTGQGYRMVTAAGLFPIKGLVDFPSNELSKSMVYMDLQTCRQFLSAPGKLTSVVMMLDKEEHLAAIKQDWMNKLPGERYVVKTWKEMQPEMVQQIEGDRASGFIFKVILYVVIFFGILGTVMMMIAERRRELGVMMAVGMKRLRLVGVLVLEMITIGLLGVLAGILGSIPLVLYFYYNPIELTGEAAQMIEQYGWEPYMFMSLSPEVFLNQALVIFVITLLIAIYPLYTIYRMNEINALRT